MYYPLAIRASGSKADSIFEEADEGKESPTKTLPISNISPNVAEQSEDSKKATDTTKEVAQDAHLPPDAPKEPSKEKKASHNMKIMLATLPIPFKEDLKGKGPASTIAAST